MEDLHSMCARYGLSALLLLTLSACEDANDTETLDEDEEGCMRARSLEIDGCPDVVGDSFCSEGRGHVAFGSEVRYEANPPHSGVHYPNAASWGLHEGTVDRGSWVHNLEHGGIVFAYNCSDCEDEVRQLRDVLQARPDMRILVTRDVELPTRFAAMSWTWSYTADEVDSDALVCFVDQHEGFAPEDIAK